MPDPISAMMGKALKNNGSLPYRWKHYPARVGVMPRDGGASDVRWFEVEPCYVFHPFNAATPTTPSCSTWCGTRRCSTPTSTARTRARRQCTAGRPPARFWTSGDRAQEFPRVDERLVGRRHRCGYATLAVAGADISSAGLIKHDLVTGTTTVANLGQGHQGGEFVFVPSSSEAAEDEGVLMGFVYDAATDRSELAILDAQTLETVASIHLPTRVPNGFHGSWAPTE